MARSQNHLERFREHCQRFREVLAILVQRTQAFSTLISRQSVPGAFRSRRHVAQRMEREFSRVFRLDDDPARLDFGRIDASLALAPAWALLNGSLRVAESTAESESECVVLIDLSRSMLSDSLAGDLSDPDNPPSKLASLYVAAGSVVGHAEACGFKIRLVFLQGDQLDVRVSHAPRDFALTALNQMSFYQQQAFQGALERPARQEPFLLADACASALARRAAGAVVIVSDFLDPLGIASRTGSTCETLIQHLLERHPCIAIDLAAPEEVEFPRPRFWDLESQRTPCRFGARHLEQGMELRYLRRQEIREWNRERGNDRRRLRDLLRRSGTEWISLAEATFPSAHRKVLAAFDRLR